jgi:outer membrane lipoprotein-sorting protein
VASRPLARHCVMRVAQGSAILPLLVAAVLCGGCGTESRSTSKASPGATGTPAPSTAAIQARYTLTFPDDNEYWVVYDVVVAGDDRIRVTRTTPTEDPVGVLRWVWDGARLLVYGNETDPPSYQLYEAPAEQQEDLQFVRNWIVDPASDDFEQRCADAQRLDAAETIAGRQAIGYGCAPGRRLQPSTLWMDKESGLWLGETLGPRDQAERGVLRADKVTTGLVIDQDAFSTDPPPGAEVEVIPTESSGAG